jgi:hypothetical protein
MRQPPAALGLGFAANRRVYTPLCLRNERLVLTESNGQKREPFGLEDTLVACDYPNSLARFHLKQVLRVTVPYWILLGHVGALRHGHTQPKAAGVCRITRRGRAPVSAHFPLKPKLASRRTEWGQDSELMQGLG